MGTVLRASLVALLLASCNSTGGSNPDAAADVASTADQSSPSDSAGVTDAPDVDRADTPSLDAPADAVSDAADALDAQPDAAEVDVSDAAVADASADAAVDVLVNGCPSLVDPVAAPDDAGADASADAASEAGVDAGDNWASYAQGFFAQWCTRCHSTTLSDPSQRNGAPSGFDWDDEGSVRARLAQIRRQVGVVNAMPFNAPFPMCDERRRIVTWIDRGAP